MNSKRKKLKTSHLYQNERLPQSYKEEEEKVLKEVRASKGNLKTALNISTLRGSENQEFDDAQLPGVSDINEQVEIEEKPVEMGFEGLIDEEELNSSEEEDEMEFEGLTDEEYEEEESSEEEEEEEFPPEPEGIHRQKLTDFTLRCRSIRIGTYKVYSSNNLSYIPVCLSTESISFQAPVLDDSSKCGQIDLRSQDITRVLVHFGKCLPVMFIFTTSGFGDIVRSALHMNSAEKCYFDPASKNDQTQKITFLIDRMTAAQRDFFKDCFLGDKKVKEIDETEANELLVKSTPYQFHLK